MALRARPNEICRTIDEREEYADDAEAYSEEGEDDGSWTTGSYTDEYSDYSDSFEPAWASHVGEKGDLFYIEPTDSAAHAASVQAQVRFETNHNNNTEIKTDSSPENRANGSAKQKDKKGIKKIKGLIGLKKKENGSVSSNGSSHASVSSIPRSVKFQDSLPGVVKEITLIVEPARRNYGRRATLCETVLGIIPGHFNSSQNDSLQNGGPVKDSRIMVQGLVPEGEALKSGQVKIGDWLMRVNDFEVNFENIDAVLANIDGPIQLKLTLQKLAIESQVKSAITRKNVASESLVQLVSGQRQDDYSPSLHGVPYAVMYLTLGGNSESMGEKEDILYQFPKEDSKLVQIRGLFMTLSHMLVDVTSSTAKNSTLLIDEQLVHVAYAKIGREVLIIAMPGKKVAMIQLNHIKDDVVRLMKVLYGSLRGAFSPSEHHGRLDHFFSLLFQRTLLNEEIKKNNLKCIERQHNIFLDTLPAMQWLNLPEEPKVSINNSLSELEATDFADMADEYYDMRRSYTVLGSSLFYKGYLIANHLHKEDLLDIYLYAKYFCLLALSSEYMVGQVVVWKEVFPTRRCHEQMDPLIPGYTEPDARWFLLIVGLKHSLLCVLLEAGGCSAWIEGHPTPDPFYVDQARATLLHLESLDLAGHCETRLQSPSIPGLVNVDSLFHGYKGESTQPPVKSSPKPSLSGSAKKVQAPDSILKKKMPSPGDKSRGGESDGESSQSFETSDGSTPVVLRRHDRKPSAGSDESGGSGSSANLFKSARKHRSMPGAYDMSTLRGAIGDPAQQEGIVKLTSGTDNALFHYLNMDNLEGVYICPTESEIGQIGGTTHLELIENFHNCCLIIKKVFEKTVAAKERAAKGIKTKLGEDTSLHSVKEHGVLFQCTPENWVDKKKEPPTLTYWVVGRLFFDPYPREFYVCFQDSAQQNLIELAFKLSLGMCV